VEPGPAEPIDGREVRATQGATAILLLAGFVFGWPWLAAAVAIVVTVGAAVGPNANLFGAAYRAVVGPRLSRPGPVEDVAGVRALDLLGAALLVPAVLAFLIGIDPLGWLLALIEAAVAAVFATTGANAAARLAERIRRGRA
jgi:hypothetical protein